MRRFYLHKRNGIFYAEIVSSSGKKLTAKSTGTQDRDEAVMIVSNWLANGIPGKKGQKPKQAETAAELVSIIKAIKKAELNKDDALSIICILRDRDLIDLNILKTQTEFTQTEFAQTEFTQTEFADSQQEKLIPFLLKFWDMENSPYLKEKITHGYRITASYCRDAQMKIKNHWQSRFTNKTINEITRKDLREFSHFLKERGLASNSIKNIMMVGKTAFKWAYREGLIPSDPSAGLMNFTGDQVSRDILTEEETEMLFKINWKNKKAYTAALLSLTTGLRSGEIRALRKNDIGERTLNILFSWNEQEGLKCPKNGEKRIVPLLPQVRNMLIQLLQESPYKDKENPFIFYSDENPDKPCCSYIFLHYFRLACKSIFISLENRKLDFHSFRHLFATRMAERIEGNKVAKITGHKSEAAAKIYQNHITARILLEMESQTALEFKNILGTIKSQSA